MTWKNILILLISILVSTGTFCYAQEADEQIEKRIQLMEMGLNLDPGQVSDLRKILYDSKKQQLDSDQPTSKDQYAHRHYQEKKRETTNKQIESILDPEQKEKFQKMVMSKNGKNDQQLLELKNKLFLSEDQLQSIEMIVMSNRNKMEEFKQSTAKNPKKYHRGMKKLMHEQAVEIEKVLTPEQVNEFRRMRKDKEKQMHKNRPKK